MKLTKNRLKKIIQEETDAMNEVRAVSLAQAREPVVRIGSMLHKDAPYGMITGVLGIHRMDLINKFKQRAEDMIRDQFAGMLIELAEQIKEEDKTS